MPSTIMNNTNEECTCRHSVSSSDGLILHRIKNEALKKWQLLDDHEDDQDEVVPPPPPPLSRWESGGSRTDQPVQLSPKLRQRKRESQSRCEGYQRHQRRYHSDKIPTTTYNISESDLGEERTTSRKTRESRMRKSQGRLSNERRYHSDRIPSTIYIYPDSDLGEERTPFSRKTSESRMRKTKSRRNHGYALVA